MLLCTNAHLHAQGKTVKIKQEKDLPYGHEFILTWEGGDYKATYYEVKGILEGASMVHSQTYLHQQQRISAMVKNPWTYDQLRALFESHGFQVVSKNLPPDVNDHQ